MTLVKKMDEIGTSRNIFALAMRMWIANPYLFILSLVILGYGYLQYRSEERQAERDQKVYEEMVSMRVELTKLNDNFRDFLEFHTNTTSSKNFEMSTHEQRRNGG
jgi:cell division protein FtsB